MLDMSYCMQPANHYLSVSNLKEVCGISFIHNENSEETDTKSTIPSFQNGTLTCRVLMASVVSIIFAWFGIGDLRFCWHIHQLYSCSSQICHPSINYRFLKAHLHLIRISDFGCEVIVLCSHQNVRTRN